MVMEAQVINIIKSYIQKNISELVKEDELFVVWSCYILGNRKFLVGWSKSNHYFELTYNKAKDEWYLDVYQKVDNECIKLN